MHSDLDKMRFTFPKDNDNLSSFDESSISEDENIPPCSTSQYDTSDVLTIEGLRRHYNSCTDCGVCWYEDHISLDCSQCGGYAMCRPCAKCNGKCGTTWRRDVTASHINNKAEWVGTCSLEFQWNPSEILDSSNLSEDKNANLEHSYHHHHHSPNHRSPTSKKLVQGAHVL